MVTISMATISAVDTVLIPELEGRVGPKYKILADAFEEAIERGELAPHTKLPSQRILSYRLGITVGTVTRAYQELELRGITQPVVGSGTYVRDRQQEQQSYYHPVMAQDGIDLSLCRPLVLSQQTHLAEVLQEIANEPTAQKAVLDYFSADGIQGHSETLQNWLSKLWQHNIDRSRLQWTYGGQHALSVILQALTRAGDAVLLEGLCYGELINTCNQLERKAIPVAIDDEGMVPEDLLLQCQRYRPRLLHLTPALQNPTGVAMSDTRRLKIIAICRRFDVLIIEDGVMYCPPELRRPPLCSIAPDITLYVGSLSKYFAGGIRVGYIVLPTSLKHPLQKALRSSCMHVSPILVDMVCRWLKSGATEKVDQDIARELAARQKLFNRIFPELKDTPALPGFNCWIPIPETIDCAELRRELEQNHIFVRDAHFFRVGSYPLPNAIRISLTGPASRDVLKQGLMILKEKIRAESNTYI